MYKKILLLASVIIVAIIGVCITPGEATAKEKQYTWEIVNEGDNNNELAIRVKHPFFAKQNNSTGDSTTFYLDRYVHDEVEGSDVYRFSSDVSWSYPETDKPCTMDRLQIDIKFTKRGASKEADKIGVSVTRRAHSDARGERTGGVQPDHVSGAGRFENCNDIYDNGTREGSGDWSRQKEYSEAVDDLRDQLKVTGEPGIAAQLYEYKELLINTKDKERKHFTDRICGTEILTPKGCTSEERKEAGDAYNVIYDYCYNVGYNSDTQGEYFKQAVTSCMEEQAGLALNAKLLDSATFTTASFADSESCSIRYIGWIVCPLSRFLGNTTDQAFKGLRSFMEIKPLNRGSNAGDVLFSAWRLVASFANVIIAVLFIVVIFSQITGMGLSNYSIKKLLPRIIVMAILVNASFYICVLAIDLSNILGAGLNSLLRLFEPSGIKDGSSWSEAIDGLLVLGGAAAGVGAIGLLVVTSGVAIMFPLLTSAALSVLVAVCMLVARYVIVVLLVVLAPIAIALALLPNTKSWYSKWQKMFLSMLLLFPLISAIYGGAQLAGVLVMNSSLTQANGDVTLKMFGLAIQALPLALTPMLMKVSGGLLSRIGTIAGNNGLFSGAKERAQTAANRSTAAHDIQHLRSTNRWDPRARMVQAKYRRQAKHQLNKNELQRNKGRYISDYGAGKVDGSNKPTLGGRAKEWAYNKYAENNGYDVRAPKPKTRGEKFLEAQAGAGGSLAQVQAANIQGQISITAPEITAHKERLIAAHGNNTAAIADVAKQTQPKNTNNSTDSLTMQQAAIELVVGSGDTDLINQLVKTSKNMAPAARQTLEVSLKKTGGGAAYYQRPEAMAAIRDGSVGDDASFTEKIVQPWINSSSVSAANLGTMHPAGIDEVTKAVNAMDSETNARKSIHDAAKRARDDSSIVAKQSTKTHQGKTAAEFLSKL